MAADQLLRLGLDHLLKLEALALLGDDAVEDHMQEQIPEFLLQPLPVLLIDGLDGLVGFFDEQMFDGGMGLLAVPRAIAPKLAYNRHEVRIGFKPGGSLGKLRFVDLHNALMRLRVGAL